MRLVTWNLDGLNDFAVDERTEAAVFTSILGARLDQLESGARPGPAPDVIVFQEVVERTYKAHLRPHLQAAGYSVRPERAPDRQVFEIVAFREPLRLYAYESWPLDSSVFGRIVHVVDLMWGGDPNKKIRVLTAHFDSGTEAFEVRKLQLRQVANLMAGQPSVFAGDANLRKAEWLGVKDELGVIDVWESLGEPASTRYTWQIDSYRARFDRVFVTPSIVATSMDPLGAAALPGVDCKISDHIALAVEFTLPL